MRNKGEKQMKSYALKYSMVIMLMILAITVGTMLLIACDDVRQFRCEHGDPDCRLWRAGDGACRFSLEVDLHMLENLNMCREELHAIREKLVGSNAANEAPAADGGKAADNVAKTE